MLYYLTEISKYIICLLMVIYSIECLIYELTGENYISYKGIFVRQRIYIFLIQIVAFATICLKTGELDYLFLGAFALIILYASIILTTMIYPRADKCLLNNMVLLLEIGFIIISRLNFNKALKQLFIVGISLAIGMFIPKLIKKWKNMEHFQWVYAVCGIVPLFIVLLLGTATHGSKISFTVAGITFQPSEFVKILFVICVAAMLSKGETIYDLILTTSVAACHVLILVASKDLGSALVFFVVYIFMVFIATRSYIYLTAGIVAGAGASVVGYKLFSHVRVRVQAFLDPFSTIDNQGYQISQSLFALGCGSFFGLGLTGGAPADIPFVESDFIFSAVCEEMGAITGICVLLVSFSSFVIIMRTGLSINKKFHRIMSSGFGIIYIFQVFLTVGGGIKFIPLTGVTLPFVSYGGSSVLTSVIIFYMCQALIINERDDEYERWLAEKEEERYLREEEEYRREEERYRRERETERREAYRREEELYRRERDRYKRDASDRLRNDEFIRRNQSSRKERTLEFYDDEGDTLKKFYLYRDRYDHEEDGDYEE